ncbi:ribosome silencing factor [uncultured Campylobacter sp.]|uniref:ribosome silencing factor n=1 Tax=uncultured Campylobacter sp. TaxID=218934 RepID=UPI002623AAB6|nr:ribosome silencing factor [uncultured Campylobacter sp.]
MKIALFGGSFDPPHAGHDAAVKAILSSLKPDLLIIMPSFLNPFKKSFSAPPQLRLRWCRALWSDAPHVEVSDYEISQNVPVPTIQSVKFLIEKYGGNSKIAAETAASTSKTRSADKIPSAASSRAPSAIMNEISNSVGNKISSTSRIPNTARNEISNASGIIVADEISGAVRNEISDVAKIPGSVKVPSAVGDKISSTVESEISSASEISSGNANCMADASGANCMGSSNSAGDTCSVNDADDASDVSSADEASKANSASGTDTAPKLYIVVGADNLAELHKWRDFSELQKLAEFVVLTRPGYEIPRQWASLRRIEIAVDASSSGFRRDFKGEIPPKIAAEVIKFYKRKDMQDPKQRAERIAEILNEKKAEDVQIIDMEGREYIAKFVVIATMLTARHAASLIEELKSVLKPLGEEFLAIESGDEWSVVDLGDIIVHLISEAYRAKYNIEDFLDKLKKEQF